MTPTTATASSINSILCQACGHPSHHGRTCDIAVKESGGWDGVGMCGCGSTTAVEPPAAASLDAITAAKIETLEGCAAAVRGGFIAQWVEDQLRELRSGSACVYITQMVREGEVQSSRSTAPSSTALPPTPDCPLTSPFTSDNNPAPADPPRLFIKEHFEKLRASLVRCPSCSCYGGRHYSTCAAVPAGDRLPG